MSKAPTQSLRQQMSVISPNMRRHGGNVPVLPQTKQCPFCNAKYTRTTHLNRHMKTHTREGLHICPRCKAEFTRTDLLARHSRACAKGTSKPATVEPSASSGSNRPTESFTGATPEDLRNALLSLTPGTASTSVASGMLHVPITPIGTSEPYPVPDANQQPPGNIFDELFNEVFLPESEVQNVPPPPRVDPHSTESTAPFDPMAGTAPSFAPTAYPNGPETEQELEQYESLFYSEYLVQMPVFHASALAKLPKYPMLVDAFRACGSLFIKTSRASAYCRRVMASSRESIPREFSRKLTNCQLSNLVLAVTLLQLIGLHHQDVEERSISSLYHGMLVMLIRRCGTLEKNATWLPPTIDPTNPTSIEIAWESWAKHETMKRSLWLSYLHDVMLRMSFALPACYLTSEINFRLPCEPKLWDAQTAIDWYAALHEPSPYGTPMERLLGVPFQHALHVLRTSRVPNNELKLVLDPMSHVIMIKALLSELYALATPVEGLPVGQKWPEEDIYRYQWSLQNWLRSWLNGPDTPPEGAEPLFFQNPLPSYWLAQISLMAYQEDMPPFQPGCLSRTDSDARWRLIRYWFSCITNFLGTDGKYFGATTTALWDDMMKIRLDGWRLEMENGLREDRSGDGVLEYLLTLSARQ